MTGRIKDLDEKDYENLADGELALQYEVMYIDNNNRAYVIINPKIGGIETYRDYVKKILQTTSKTKEQILMEGIIYQAETEDWGIDEELREAYEDNDFNEFISIYADEETTGITTIDAFVEYVNDNGWYDTLPYYSADQLLVDWYIVEPWGYDDPYEQYAKRILQTTSKTKEQIYMEGQLYWNESNNESNVEDLRIAMNANNFQQFINVYTNGDANDIANLEDFVEYANNEGWYNIEPYSSVDELLIDWWVVEPENFNDEIYVECTETGETQTLNLGWDRRADSGEFFIRKNGTYTFVGETPDGKTVTQIVRVEGLRAHDDDDVPDLLWLYVMGHYGLGRDFGSICYEKVFIDDYETITDAHSSVKYLCYRFGDDNVENFRMDGALFVYIKYNNAAYRIEVDDINPNPAIISLVNQNIVKIYEPHGREGDIINFKANVEDDSSRAWLVLYDNENTLDAVSVDLDENWEFDLGCNTLITVGNTDAEKGMDSYNNAVSRLNNYCETIVTNPLVQNVRSIGTGFGITGTSTYFSSTFLANNPSGSVGKYNRGGASQGLEGDLNYEQDLVRMSYFSPGDYQIWGYSIAGSEGYGYWLASRAVGITTGTNEGNGINFSVRFMSRHSGNEIECADIDLCTVFTNKAECYYKGIRLGVRPVARVLKSNFN